MTSDENERLLSLLRKSNVNAFKEIHAIYGKFVHFQALTILKNPAAADDILQDVFIQLWEQRKQLPKAVSLKTYLLDLVKQACEIQLLARRQILRNVNFRVEVSNGFSELVNKELLERVHEAILHIYPPACREILRLHIVEQKSYKEIAADMNIQVAVVRNQVCRARKILRIMLGLY